MKIAYDLGCLACTVRESKFSDNNVPLGELVVCLDDESLEGGERGAIPVLSSRQMGVNNGSCHSTQVGRGILTTLM